MTPETTHGQHADGERDLPAVQDAGEEVAAELVGAEEVAVGERRQAPGGEVLGVGVRQRQHLGQHDRQDHQQRCRWCRRSASHFAERSDGGWRLLRRCPPW